MFLLGTSCGNRGPDMVKDKYGAEEVAADSIDASAAQPLTAQPVYFDYKNTSLDQDFNDTLFCKFSNDSVNDRFSFSVPKGNISDTKAILRITTKAGLIIYEHIFGTYELASGYHLETVRTDNEMRAYILDLAKDLLPGGIIDPNNLDKNNYLSQATKEDFIDYETFVETKLKNRKLFFYNLHEESGTFLGYSGKEKKVVEVAGCC